MQKIATKQKRRKLNIIHPYAAGIDIGSRFHVVAVPPDLDDEPTRTFNSFTGELQVLVQWLIGLGITIVAGNYQERSPLEALISAPPGIVLQVDGQGL